MVRPRFPQYELLIADDDAGFREALRDVLEPHFPTVEASCGEEALEIVQRQEVHLVMLDMHMYELTGLDTLRMVKAIRAALPCIILTACPTEQLRHDAALAEAYTVLQKPATRRELVGTISSALDDVYHDPQLSNLRAS